MAENGPVKPPKKSKSKGKGKTAKVDLDEDDDDDGFEVVDLTDEKVKPTTEVKQCLMCEKFEHKKDAVYIHSIESGPSIKARVVSQFAVPFPVSNLAGLGVKLIRDQDVHYIQKAVFTHEEPNDTVPKCYHYTGHFNIIESDTEHNPFKLFVSLQTACLFFHSMWTLDAESKATIHASVKLVDRHLTLAMLLNRITHIRVGDNGVDWTDFVRKVCPHVNNPDKALEAIFGLASSGTDGHQFMANAFIPLSELMPARRFNAKTKEAADGSSVIIHKNSLVSERTCVFSDDSYDGFVMVMSQYAALSSENSLISSRVSERGTMLVYKEIIKNTEAKLAPFLSRFPMSVKSSRCVNGAKRKASAAEDKDAEAKPKPAKKAKKDAAPTEEEVKLMDIAAAKLDAFAQAQRTAALARLAALSKASGASAGSDAMVVDSTAPPPNPVQALAKKLDEIDWDTPSAGGGGGAAAALVYTEVTDADL